MALTATERSERAKEAASARWSAKENEMQQWHDLEYEAALSKYGEMRVKMAEIGRILAQRQPRSEDASGGYTCTECQQPMRKIIYTEPVKDKDTGIFSNIFICSTICHNKFMTKRLGGVIKT